MNNTKVIYISRATFPNNSANSIHLMKMASAIAKIYSDVTLIGFKAKTKKYSIDQIFKIYNVNNTFSLKLISTPRRGILLYLHIYVFFWLLFKHRKNYVIYSREINILNIAMNLGFKFILESHDFFNSKKRRTIERKLFNNQNFLKLVVISEALKKDYLEFFKNIDKIEVHADAADIDNYSLSDNISWPSQRTTLQIGYFGHLYSGRGIELILNVAKELANYDFHIVGGNDSDISTYKNIVLSSNVYFHGFKEQTILSAMRKKCDILLMPYQEDVGIFNLNKSTAKWMSPMKLFEYMSSKRAIISSNLPVLREILNSENSILVRPDSVFEWISAIKMLSDVGLREKIANNAYKDFLDNYTWTKRAEKIFSNI